jgi:hypothetical protein
MNEPIEELLVLGRTNELSEPLVLGRTCTRA